MEKKTPSVRIVIASHREYEVPTDPVYLPLQVGAKGKPHWGWQRDDEGENISEKNSTYCELTGLYWAWKNLDADAIGLVHYRRHFTLKTRRERRKTAPLYCVLTGEEVKRLLSEADVLVPRRRSYVIETLYSHYAHTHNPRHLDLAKEILSEQHPEDLPACEEVYNRRWGYMFNMCVLPHEELGRYCAWLFPILSELETRVAQVSGAKEESDFDRRFCGRVSEILFNVWLLRQEQTRDFKVCEVPWFSLEPEPVLKKAAALLAAKLFGRRYTKSF